MQGLAIKNSTNICCVSEGVGELSCFSQADTQVTELGFGGKAWTATASCFLIYTHMLCAASFFGKYKSKRRNARTGHPNSRVATVDGLPWVSLDCSELFERWETLQIGSSSV